MDSTAAFNSLGPLQLELILSTATAGMQTFGARCCVILLAAAMITAVAGDTAFDWGRPCTLTTAASKAEIQSSCKSCGSGATATPDATCGFNDITIPASGTIDFAYHSSVHNLFVGSSPCAFTTEICPAQDAAVISAASPCKYSPGKPGVYYISDKQDNYCATFDAHLKVTAT